MIRYSASGLRYDDKKLEPTNGLPGDPVSFENSAVSWVFWAQSFGWAAACAAFVSELMSLGYICYGTRIYGLVAQAYGYFKSQVRDVGQRLLVVGMNMWPTACY